MFSVLPDYAIPGNESPLGTSLAGIAGAVICALLLGIAGYFICRSRKKAAK